MQHGFRVINLISTALLILMALPSTAEAQGFFATGAMWKYDFCRDKNWTTYDASGAGTEASPYLICRAAQLANIGTNWTALNKHYKLMGDIDFAPYYAVPNAQFQIGLCTTGCAPWDGAWFFSGVFDGNNHTLRNYSFVSPGTRGSGLFAAMFPDGRRARIKNLRMANVNVSGGEFTGGLVGMAEYTAIENCHVTGTVTGNGQRVGGIVGSTYHQNIFNSSFSGIVSSSATNTGGIVGLMDSSVMFAVHSSGTVSSSSTNTGGLMGTSSGASAVIISNSYSRSTVIGTSQVGGLVGRLDNGGTPISIITKSYFSGSVSGNSEGVGGIVGHLWASTILDSYNVGNVSRTVGSGLVGPIVGRDDGGGSAITNSYYLSTASCTGTCNSTGSSHATLAAFFNSANAPMSNWDKSGDGDGPNDFWNFDGATHAKLWFQISRTFKSPFSGNGTAASPYLIGSVADFNKVGQNPRWMGAEFRQTANIDFTSGAFTQISGLEAGFSGRYDGNGMSVSNIVNSRPGHDMVGIFGAVRGGGEVTNLTANSVTISGRHEVGGMIGLFDSSKASILRVVGGTVTGSGNRVGGVFGTATKCHNPVTQLGNTANVSGVDYVGGITGFGHFFDPQRVFNRGNISGNNRVGGIAGAGINLLNGYSTGNVTGTGSRVGGIAGGDAYIERAYSTGAVTGTSRVGGIVGDGGTNNMIRAFTTSVVNGTGDTAQVGWIRGTGTGTFTHVYYWSGATCDSTGSGGSCNTNGTGSQADVTYFHTNTNPPLSLWGIPTTWTLVGGTFPKLTWEP